MKNIVFKNVFAIAPCVIALGMIACNNPTPENNTVADSIGTTAKDSTPAPQATHAAHDTATVALVAHAEANITATYSDTAVTGSAKFDSTKNGKVKLVLTLSVPSKAGKSVAVHFHEHGDCGDKGNLSHGHWNPTQAQHGKWGTANFHSGDIGNIKLDKKGNATFDVETDLWTLGGPAKTNILNKALIVHSGEDDYKSQPSGNSGNRIGCGVIQ